MLSAREMAEEYEIENPLLISLYEKARYSGKQCSDEETTSVEYGKYEFHERS